MKTLKKRVLTGNKVAVISFLLISGFNSLLYSDVNREISGLYLSAADSFLRENKSEEAAVFLNKAILYDDTVSDIYYLKASISSGTDHDITDAINNLKKAITYRNWTIYKENNAFYELGLLYSRTKDYDRALSSLYVVRDEYIDNEKFIDSYSTALINRGSFSEAREILNYAAEKFPQNTIFINRLAGIDKSYMNKLLLRILDGNEHYKYPAAVLLELTRLSDDTGIKKELLEKIGAESKATAEYFLEKKSVEKIVNLADVETFVELDGLSNYRFIRYFNSLISERAVRDYYIEKIRGYSGFLREDINGDGISEKIMFYNAGMPEWYSEDNNQDNINDMYAAFERGKPVFVNIDETMLVSYYEYPIVKTVFFFGREYNEIYNFRERRAALDILSYSNILQPPVLNRDAAEMFDMIKNRAENYRKSSSGEKLKVLMEYFKTENIRNFETYDDITGIIKRGVSRNEKTVFSMADINRDNVFETREIYRDGELQSINYDGNNNGIFEFSIKDNVKYWDVNEDGLFDIKEWTEGESTRYTEYSTRLDGVYNFAARYMDGRLTDVRKNDSWMRTDFDSAENIYWIGDKCSGFRRDSSMQNEGIINCGDKTVYYILIGKDFFAEVID